MAPAIHAQDDLLDMLESEDEATAEPLPVKSTWKTMKLVNLHTTEMVKHKGLDFRVTHRFGNIGEPSGGGPHNLWGLDNSADIRISFDYGITDDLQIGIGRSKYNELIDASVKWRILSQKTKGMPVSVVFYANGAITPERDPDNRYDDWRNRMSYFTQILIARKFSDRLSFEVAPGMLYRNMVERVVDGEGNTLTDEHTNFVVGLGGRFMITKRFGIMADYVQVFSEFRQNYKPKNYYPPLGLGMVVETGGHVFHLTLTNAPGIVANNYIPETTDSWMDGGMKLGFNISRVFHF
ncbi:hypothetical protein KFE98_08770 [bacterium SCSIO 12741]|nr:hypothetical protein KFE98_08770 [bacterium SCSIO 12741]